MKFSFKGKDYDITEAQHATIQTMYYAMCKAEDEGEVGSHCQLINAFNAAGVRGLSKSDARKLGDQLC